MRCKQQSGDAMRRFSRYVKKNILEAMMFCQCSFSDVTCKHQQQWIYPRCLYDSFHKKPRHSCTETCRLALIGVRGTHLESPCYCEKDDERCLEHQNMVLPNNPCVEDAMIDYVNGGSGEDEEENEIPPPPPKNYRRGQKKPKANESKRTTTTTAEPPASVESEAPPTSAENSTDGRVGGKKDNANELPTPVPIVKTEAPSKGTKITKKPGTATAARVVNAPQLVTQTPPPKDGGCSTRNLEGGWITHYKNSIFRMYSDLAGRLLRVVRVLEKRDVHLRESRLLAGRLVRDAPKRPLNSATG
ncbi:hypothetical protein M3Y99_01844500 [Aphelenchoides fujianensis]|nr:hypothetical protein M3Y99_01844500 [Aphelenchoides fujianensis]